VPTFEVEGKKYDVDEDGFLQEPDLWTEDVATDFAKSESIDALTEGHWKVINYIRNYYLQFGIAPMVRKVCKETGYKLGEIYQLFPSGPAKGACKLAGLPKPTGCV
jgi:dissimilatory sulfite reductase related protein